MQRYYCRFTTRKLSQIFLLQSNSSVTEFTKGTWNSFLACPVSGSFIWYHQLAGIIIDMVFKLCFRILDHNKIEIFVENITSFPKSLKEMWVRCMYHSMWYWHNCLVRSSLVNSSVVTSLWLTATLLPLQWITVLTKMMTKLSRHYVHNHISTFYIFRVLLGNKIKFIPDRLFNLPNLERM
jgi:hypothetical protein